jgi:hypothetical protein
MTKTGRVVDLRTRSGHRPDFAALARRRLLVARHTLDLSAAEFAAMLTPLVGWPVSAKAVEAWESNSVPPGDVLVAVGTVVDGPTQPLNVLSAVSPSFSAETLCGHWATCFRFGTGSDRKSHVDVAQIASDIGNLLAITNSQPMPRSEGRASPFRNDLDAQLTNRHLVGHWKNCNDTRYFGTFQLAVLPGETVMAGYYTGFGSDVEVSTGPWKWVRIAADSITGVDLAKVKLRDPVELGALIENHSQYDPALMLADIEQEP